MNILIRFLLFLYALCTLALSVLSLLVISDNLKLNLITSNIEMHIGNKEIMAYLGGFILVSFISILIALYSKHKKRMLLQTNGVGKIYITVDAIEKMVERSMRQVYGIHNPKISITFTDKDVSVKILTDAHPDCLVAEATQAVQECVQKDLSTSLNKEINKVEVLVNTVK